MSPIKGQPREDGRLFWCRYPYGHEVWLWPVAFGLRNASAREKYRTKRSYKQSPRGSYGLRICPEPRVRASAVSRPVKFPSEPTERKNLRHGDRDAAGRYFLGYTSRLRVRGVWGSFAALEEKRARARKAVGKVNAAQRERRDMARGFCRWRPKTKAPKILKPRLTEEQKRKNVATSRKKWKVAYRQRCKTDPVLRAMNQHSMRLRHFVRKGCGSNAAGVGCTRDFFRQWIGQQFKDGMSWDNYGKVWSLDHILPQSWFKTSECARRYLMNHYTNLRPLFSLENGARCDRVTRSEFSLALQRVPDEWRDTVFELARKAPPLLENPEVPAPVVQQAQCFTC